MEYIFTTAGTLGDVLPIISLALAVRESGASATVIAPAAYRGISEYNRVPFIPLAPDEESARGSRDLPLLSSRYVALFIQRHAVNWNATVYRTVREMANPRTVLITAARGFLWADACASMHLNLSALRVHIDLPGIDRGPRRVWLPETAIQRRLVQGSEVRWRRLASEIGIHAGPRHLERIGRHRVKLPGFGLYPQWLADHNDSRQEIQGVGFCSPPPFPPGFSTVSNTSAIPGSPIVFTLGSEGTTASWAARLLDVAARVCVRLGCEGLIVGGGEHMTGCQVEPPLTWARFAPLDQVLQTARAIVHHGGMGTAAIALQNGVPQVIVPRVFTQHRNAECFGHSGAAVVLSVENFISERVISAIQNATALNGKARQSQIDVGKFFEIVDREVRARAGHRSGHIAVR
jgi:UDP:flavonoid glycosyltransferase YjiC (YdhE family)